MNLMEESNNSNSNKVSNQTLTNCFEENKEQEHVVLTDFKQWEERTSSKHQTKHCIYSNPRNIMVIYPVILG